MSAINRALMRLSRVTESAAMGMMVCGAMLSLSSWPLWVAHAARAVA